MTWAEEIRESLRKAVRCDTPIETLRQAMKIAEDNPAGWRIPILYSGINMAIAQLTALHSDDRHTRKASDG